MNIEELTNENEMLKLEIVKLKRQLDIYSHSQKEYYEKNKEYVKSKAKEGLKKLAIENPEKLKEYRRNCYLKRKEKLKQIELEKESI